MENEILTNIIINTTNSNISNEESKKIIKINKNKIKCINCFQNSISINFLKCCLKFICSECSFYYKDSKCTNCKMEKKISKSPILRNFVLKTLYNCPICKITLKSQHLPSHLAEFHMKFFLETKFYFKNKTFIDDLNIILQKNGQSIQKFFNHDHVLERRIRLHEENKYCRLGESLNYPNCTLRSKNINSDLEKKESDIDMIEKNKELNKEEKLKFIFNFFYKFYCEECDDYFCDACLNIEKIGLKSDCHQHILNLVDRDNGWGCDGRNTSSSCLSGITGFRQTNGMSRYRCDDCDFDLCEKCMIFHLKKN